jgi:2,3-bisphosphoglycerate-independent phosphoglycerate mutase
LVLRGPGLGADVRETDPQATGVPPLLPDALHPDSERTARILREFFGQIPGILADEPRIHGVLARGFARFEGIPSVRTRFGLRAAAHARYPMYRGVARLVGMEIPGIPATDEGAVAQLERTFLDYDFHFLHMKAPDARGEDGDFEGKVAAIEAIDAWIPRIRALQPEVLWITGDHCTPATLAAHSWHPVPLLLHSRWVRPSADRFHEGTCRTGDLGTVRGQDLMALALAHAGRLGKFGA